LKNESTKCNSDTTSSKKKQWKTELALIKIPFQQYNYRNFRKEEQRER